ncbi:RDD family protein [Histidinibacterium lentulum]|uniref:RDD family protein n=1 Tax=Histidinibacterium lentulum TaxID=2480588 RepID=A0A3N2QTN3_9RHOB|nr:RDD family protein [Histidinibacterium lentulum]ROT98568.1 RDD family protein [Histidinibacterium lentulum]
MTDPSFAFSATRLPDPALRPDFYRAVPAKRLGAWIVDILAVAVACMVLLPFTAFTGIFFFPLMMLVVGFLYRWSTIAQGSATPGMWLMGIEFRDRDGERLSGGTAFAHTLLYSVSLAVAPLQLISVILMLVTPRRQGLGDHLLGTAAINRPL